MHIIINLLAAHAHAHAHTLQVYACDACADNRHRAHVVHVHILRQSNLAPDWQFNIVKNEKKNS